MFATLFKAIKYTAIFIYHILFIDQTTGEPSNTKFFANVGYGIWCVLFPWVVLKGLQTNMELWMVFGAVVIGNRTLNVMMQNKYGGAPANPQATWAGGVGAPTPADPTTVTTSTTVTTAPTTVTTSTPASTTTSTTTGPTPPAAAGPNVPKTDDLVN